MTYYQDEATRAMIRRRRRTILAIMKTYKDKEFMTLEYLTYLLHPEEKEKVIIRNEKVIIRNDLDWLEQKGYIKIRVLHHKRIYTYLSDGSCNRTISVYEQSKLDTLSRFISKSGSIYSYDEAKKVLKYPEKIDNYQLLIEDKRFRFTFDHHRKELLLSTQTNENLVYGGVCEVYKFLFLYWMLSENECIKKTTAEIMTSLYDRGFYTDYDILLNQLFRLVDETRLSFVYDKNYYGLAFFSLLK